MGLLKTSPVWWRLEYGVLFLDLFQPACATIFKGTDWGVILQLLIMLLMLNNYAIIYAASWGLETSKIVLSYVLGNQRS